MRIHRDFIKVKKVIESCTNKYQCHTAENMIKNYEKLYNKSTSLLYIYLNAKQKELYNDMD